MPPSPPKNQKPKTNKQKLYLGISLSNYKKSKIKKNSCKKLDGKTNYL